MLYIVPVTNDESGNPRKEDVVMVGRGGKNYIALKEKSVDLFRQVTGFYRNDFLFYVPNLVIL